MKSLLMIACVCGAGALAAQEPWSISDFIAADGSGLAKIEQIYHGSFQTTELVVECAELEKLAGVLLDQAVMEQARKLPNDAAMILVKSNLLWWKYFDATPSLPNCAGRERGIEWGWRDYLRVKARWEAAKLPYQEYLVYAKIANSCQVRLDRGTFKMRFGEICLRLDADWSHDEEQVGEFGRFYHHFPVVLLPETCRAAKDHFVAALKTNADNTHYLCVWDKAGDPLAVYQLPTAEAIRSLTVSDTAAVVVFADGQKRETQLTFPLDRNNNAVIPAGA